MGRGGYGGNPGNPASGALGGPGGWQHQGPRNVSGGFSQGPGGKHIDNFAGHPAGSRSGPPMVPVSGHIVSAYLHIPVPCWVFWVQVLLGAGVLGS